MYLLDTSILFELLLDQANANEVEGFLRSVPKRQLHLSDFSMHSNGVRLVRENAIPLFKALVSDLLVPGDIRVVALGIGDMSGVVEIAQRYHLDFDDAYQYTLAEKLNLTILSFDAHFDKTPRGRKTPAQITKGT